MFCYITLFLNISGIVARHHTTLLERFQITGGMRSRFDELGRCDVVTLESLIHRYLLGIINTNKAN
jgi:hypothetical protein